jgi:hypothetical protein
VKDKEDFMYKSYIALFFLLLIVSPVVFGEIGVGESTSGFLTSLPPAAPELSVPENGMTEVPDTMVFYWFCQPHAATYSLQIASTVDFDDLIVNESDLSDTVFTVIGLAHGVVYYWRVSAANVAGRGAFSPVWDFTTAGVAAVDPRNRMVPQQYALLPVYPNPFNPWVTITYALPEPEEVSVVIYNHVGQAVCELATGVHQTGRYSVQWDGRDSYGRSVTSGVYLCRFEAGDQVFRQKMVMVR